MTTRLYWTPRGSVFHTRPSCCVRRVGDQRESDLAVLALPKLRAKGRRLCKACEQVGAA